jgi:hypothetical protein
VKSQILAIILSMVLAVLSGCATAGSTVTGLNQQSIKLSQKLQAE